MLNASVGVQRVMGRLRRPTRPEPSRPEPTLARLDGIPHISSRSAARQARERLHATAASSRRPITLPQLSLTALTAPRRLTLPSFAAVRAATPDLRLPHPARHLGHEKTVAIVVAGIVLGAAVFSAGPSGPTGDTGGPTGDGPAPRLAVGGAFDESDGLGEVEAAYVEEVAVEGDPVDEADAALGYTEPAPAVSALSRIVDVDSTDPEAQAAIAAMEAEGTSVEGPFLADGTLLKPVAVDTSVADGRDLVKRYRVKKGDTLSGIAAAHGVSMKTLWWANDLDSRHDLHQGQILKIPPVSGLVVTVKATDTLASLAKEHKVSESRIVKINGLEDTNLVVGQVLILPGAKGEPLPTPKPTKKPTPKATSRGGGSGSSRGSTRPPRTYSGGRFAWPAPGGRISQYYHYGHYGVDIDGSTGDRIVAAASGTVIFSGWKSNGGGYQVWIAHGSGLYTTYNHMSSVAVGRGQHVSKGQRVGRMGATGFASGSHLHFEVWKGPIWNGGRRVNPLAYY